MAKKELIINDELQRKIFALEYLKDLDAGRAALAAGYPTPDKGYELLLSEDVVGVITGKVTDRHSNNLIDAHKIMLELWDNAQIAKQRGNISASNAALGLLMKHSAIDAMAATKVDVDITDNVVERLQRARKRVDAVTIDHDVISDDSAGITDHDW